MKLIAVRPMTYATRRLMAGDAFEASPAHGRVLVAIKKARPQEDRDLAELPAPPEGLLNRALEPGRDPAPLAPPPAGLAERAAAGPLDHDNKNGPGGSAAPEASERLTELRVAYKAATGKRFFAGWDEAELQRRIDEAKAAGAQG